MNNADMPAMALSGHAYQDYAVYDGIKNTTYYPQCHGLTKREQFAAMAMQGLAGSGTYHTWQDMAEDAVSIADALLAVLARESE